MTSFNVHQPRWQAKHHFSGLMCTHVLVFVTYRWSSHQLYFQLSDVSPLPCCPHYAFFTVSSWTWHTNHGAWHAICFMTCSLFPSAGLVSLHPLAFLACLVWYPLPCVIANLVVQSLWSCDPNPLCITSGLIRAVWYTVCVFCPVQWCPLATVVLYDLFCLLLCNWFTLVLVSSGCGSILLNWSHNEVPPMIVAGSINWMCNVPTCFTPVIHCNCFLHSSHLYWDHQPVLCLPSRGLRETVFVCRTTKDHVSTH